MEQKKKFKAIKPAKQIGVSYNAKLQKIVNEIRKDINNQIMPLLRNLEPQYVRDSYMDDIIAALALVLNKWDSQAFRLIAAQTASQFVNSADKYNSTQTINSFGFDLYAGNPDLVDYIKGSIYDNTQLIKSIPAQYLKNVESLVMTNVRSGQRSSAIQGQLSKQYGLTQARAKMIARDQTAKMNGDLSSKRQEAAGFEYFQWIDSGDFPRVRTRHHEIDNKITAYGKGVYRWDNPPLSDEGKPIIPGSDYQCRCTARPVLASEVEANQKAGRVAKGVKR